jgi:hypothetical protein
MKKIILPFIIVFSNSAFADVNDMISNIAEQYKMLGGHKALVVAMDDDRYAAGWGFKFSNTRGAIAKAMAGCEKSRLNYQVQGSCHIYMIGSVLQNRAIQSSSIVEEVVSSSSNNIASKVSPSESNEVLLEEQMISVVN